MQKTVKVVLVGIAVATVFIVILYQAGIFNFGAITPGETMTKFPADKSRGGSLIAQNIPIIYKAVGTVRSRDEIELSSRIVARTIEVTKRSGDSVKKGEILVKLDSSDLLAVKQRAAERVTAAEIALDWAGREYKRQQLLLKKNVVSRKSFEQAEEVWKASESAVKAARQSLKEAEVNLSYTIIKSPMDGIVADRFKDPGDLAAPGNIIMKIFDPARLMLYVPLRESLVRTVKVGDKVKFSVDALNRTFTGEVREIVPAVDPGSRTFMVKMCILGNTKELMPGMFGTIKLKLGTEKAWLVPATAIKRIGQLEYLPVTGKDGKTRQLLVRTVPGPKPGILKVVSGLPREKN